MKLARFFLLSAAIHAAVLFLPFSFTEKSAEQLLPVTLVLLEQIKKSPQALSVPGKRVKIKEPLGQISKQPVLDTNEPIAIQETGSSDLIRPQPTAQSESARAAPSRVEPAIAQTTNSPNLPLAESVTLKKEQSVERRVASSNGEAARTFSDVGKAERREEVIQPSFIRASYAYNLKPEYPDLAKREGWEGTVLLRVRVNGDGMPETIEIKQSSGFDVLDRAAHQTVRDWRFQPARLGEQKIASWVQVPIVFRLTDPEALSSVVSR